MKNILAENLLRFGVKNLNEKDRVVLSEALLLEADLAPSPDFAAAAKAFKAVHKGTWANAQGTTLSYAGATYFICISVPAVPSGGVAAKQQSVNCIQIKPNRYGVPMPYWAGLVWINENGTAMPGSANEPPAAATFYPDVKAGWAGLTGDDINGIKQYGTFGTNWTTYCTKQAATVSAMTSVKSHVSQNLDKYKKQPTGFTSDLWLTIKPLVGA
jgi:hypothetical protein